MSSQPASHIVSVPWVAENLDRDDVVILCANFGDKNENKTALPGAVLADVEGEFSVAGARYPHTMPPAEEIAQAFAACGVTDDSTVVVYDRFGVMVAPRVWWLARCIGLDNVVVMDGGLPEWVRRGLPMGKLVEHPSSAPGQLTIKDRRDGVLDMEGVKKALVDDDTVVIDARAAGRFRGVDPEPREGYVSGHMPGSVNIPFTELFPGGLYIGDEAARKVFDEVTGGESRIVTSCGSGVTACVDALVAAELGLGAIGVYEGSYSEWGDPTCPQPIVRD